jgi:toxin-antitoxin system PIN domain toxin
VIAIDTNILVYARRTESPHHAAASALIGQLAEGSTPWALPWPVVYEFVRVVTHPRVFAPPSPLDAVLRDLESLLASPSLTMLGEGHTHGRQMVEQMRKGAVSGNLAHDAHIAALVVEHGVTELLTADRDFARFPGVRSRNPFSA